MAAMSWRPAGEFQMYRRIGADRVGYNARKGDEVGWPTVDELARANGLRVDYVCHGLTARADDDAQQRREVEFLRDSIRAAAEIGAATVFVTSGPSGALSWEDAAQHATERLGPIAEDARALGVTLAVENTMSIRSDLSFTHSLRDAAALARALSAGLCVDLYCCWQEAGLLDTLSANLDLIRIVQISDFRTGTLSTPNRWVPGDGEIPLDRLLGEVLDLGYDGLVDVELLGPAIDAEGAESALRRGLEWVRSRMAAEPAY